MACKNKKEASCGSYPNCLGCGYAVSAFTCPKACICPVPMCPTTKYRSSQCAAARAAIGVYNDPEEDMHFDTLFDIGEYYLHLAETDYGFDYTAFRKSNMALVDGGVLEKTEGKTPLELIAASCEILGIKCETIFVPKDAAALLEKI